MIVEIKNNKFCAAIETDGAHLRRFYDIANDDEIMWSGDPEVWSGVAPILFPVIGRLKGGQYTYNGRAYQIPKHGFARDMEFTVVEQSESMLKLALLSCEQTKVHYPFDFEFTVTFSFDSKGISVDYLVKNTGSEQMLFTIGSHPAISLPPEGKPYYVKFEKPETIDVYRLEDGLIGLEGTPCLDGVDEIHLAPDIFNNDALIFKNISSSSIQIIDDSAQRTVTVETGGAPHLGLWAKPAADYVCIEPWFGYDDDINGGGELKDKPEMISLETNCDFITGYKIYRS